jgi:hypothetical protein
MVVVLFATLLVADPPGAVIEVEKTVVLQDEADEAEQRWKSAALGNYSYQLKAGGPFGYITYVISVEGNECKAKARSTFGKRTTRWKRDTCDGQSMRDLFVEFRRQLSYAQERIELSFDLERGYPTKASFQPHDSDDQSEYFEITKFETRPPSAPNTSLERTRD